MKRRRSLTLLLLMLFLPACAGRRSVDPSQVAGLPTASMTAASAPTQIPPEVPTLIPSPVPPTSTIAPTTTSSPTPAPLRFAVIGDYGEGNQGELDVSNMVKSWSPDFVITVGDNNYPSGASETIDDRIGKYYGEFIAPYNGAYGPGAPLNRFFPTLGNHDLDTAGGRAYFDYFTLPGNERYYDFVIGPVHFFALNSDSREPDGVSAGSVQAQWLQAGLAASTTPWQIVYFHTAPFSSGYHGPVTWMRWPFAAWGADAVLAGHEHVYERLLVDGIPYLTNGLGGGPIYYFTTVDPQSQVRYADDYGAMRVAADAQQIVFEFFTRTGILIDTYTIKK